MMNQIFKRFLILIAVLFVFLGFKTIQAFLNIEDKLILQPPSGDNMIILNRGDYTYTIAVGTIDDFVIKNTSSVVIFKIDEFGNIYFPGKIIENISLSNITDFPPDCATGTFIYGINDDAERTFKCRDLSP